MIHPFMSLNLLALSVMYVHVRHVAFRVRACSFPACFALDTGGAAEGYLMLSRADCGGWSIFVQHQHDSEEVEMVNVELV